MEQVERWHGRKVWNLRQVHGDVIIRVADDADTGSFPPVGDGLMTDQRGVLLTIGTADCLPVILIDRDCRAVAALHAGWRGTALNIAGKAVSVMKRAYGTEPGSLLAGIGPGIHACCFEVGPDVWQVIKDRYRYGHSVISHDPDGEKAHVDLVALNRFQLMEAGLPPEQIVNVDLCTVCNEALFRSYRREKCKVQNMVSGVMLT